MKDIKKSIERLRSLHEVTRRAFVQGDMLAEIHALDDESIVSLKMKVTALATTVKGMLAEFDNILTVLEEMCDQGAHKKDEVRVHLDSGEFLKAFEAKVNEFKEIARKSNESLGKLVMQQLTSAMNLSKSDVESIHDEQVRVHLKECERFTVVLKNYMRENWLEELSHDIAITPHYIERCIMRLLDQSKGSGEEKKEGKNERS